MRIFYRAGIERAATVFTERKIALCTVGGGLDEGARRTFYQFKTGSRGGDIGPEGRA